MADTELGFRVTPKNVAFASALFGVGAIFYNIAGFYVGEVAAREKVEYRVEQVETSQKTLESKVDRIDLTTQEIAKQLAHLVGSMNK